MAIKINFVKEIKQEYKRNRRLRLISYIGVAVFVLALAGFFISKSLGLLAWVGYPPILPTETPPVNVSSSSAPSTKAAIASDPANLQNLYAVWEEDSNIWFAKSTNGGSSWSAPANISSADTNTPHSKPDVAYAGGRIHVAYKNSLGVAYLYNDGTNWQTIVMQSIYPAYDLAIAAYNQTVVIQWTRIGGGAQPKMAYSSDGGTTSPFNNMANFCGSIGGETRMDLTVSQSGKWMFASTFSEPNQLIVCGSTNGVSWPGSFNFIDASLSNQNPSISALPFIGDQFYIAYENNTSGKSVIKAMQFKFDYTVIKTDTVSDPAIDAYNPAITVDVNGYAHVAWQSETSIEPAP